MKQLTISLAAGVIALIGVSSAQAQYVTGQQYLSNINPSSTSPSGDWLVSNMSDSGTGLQISATNDAFSTLYYPLPAGQVTALMTSDTEVQFTWTWTAGDAVAGINVLFALDDANAGTDYYDAISPAYSLTPTVGTTYTVTLPLQAPNQANIAGGFPVNGLNFQLDPGNVNGDYTITFNSIQIITTPEPSTLALSGLSALGLLVFRKRK